MEQIPIHIGGTPITTADSAEVTSPYDGRRVALVPRCGPEHVDAACAAAAKALERGDFAQYRRAEVLDRAAVLLAQRRDEFARTITLETAKPIRDSRVEVDRCVDTLRFSAAEARRLVGEMVPMDASQAGAGRLGFAIRVPAGVVAAITPFNFPLNLVAHKLGPAIAAGCPAVLKPAEDAPVSAIRLVDLLIEAGLPEDWISVVTGTGPDVGAPLVAHPVPKVVSFTGSLAVGTSIASSACSKKVALELGSNAPVIVEPDADLDRAVTAVCRGAFSFAGQSCISTQRVLVHKAIKDDFVHQLREAVRALKVGDPLDEATVLGPMIRPGENDRVLAWIHDAVARGGELVTGGEVVDGILLPTVVDEPPLDCELVRREVFGPVVTVTGYACFDEAFALCNDSDFGLHAGVFTRDVGIALRAIRELDFGGVLVNEVPTFRADQQPYGGLRDSGNTREGPAYAVRELTELRFVLIAG